MAYNYVTRYGAQLNSQIVQGLMTGALETPADTYRWLDAKTFMEQSLLPSGLQTHVRNKGYNYGTLDTEQVPMTLRFDRDIEFYVDVMDQSETGQLLTMGNVSRELISQRVIPETDAYRFMRLAEYAAANGQSTTETITADNVLEVLNRMQGTVRNYGIGNTIFYVSSAVMNAIAASPDFQRVFVVNPGPIMETSSVTTRIGSLNGFTFVEVWDADRLYTAFDFTDGFQPVTGVSQPINILAVHQPSVIAVIRHNSIYMHEPGSVGQGDGWLYQYRLYHDIFQRPNRPYGIVASVGAAIA